MITNPQSRTNIHEIADGIYRIDTPLATVQVQMARSSSRFPIACSAASIVSIFVACRN